MGEARKDVLRLKFDRRLKLEFHGTNVTSDAGLLAYRELDGALGLTSTIESELRDIRTGKNTQHDIAAVSQKLVADNATGEAHQDRCQGGQTFPVRRVPDGGGGCAEGTLR